MIEIKWACAKCKHEQDFEGECEIVLDLRKHKKAFDFETFSLKCKKCGKEAEFQIDITDLQGVEC